MADYSLIKGVSAVTLVKECFTCNRCFGDHNENCDVDQTLLETTLPGLPLIKNKYRLDKRISRENININYLGFDIEKRHFVIVKIFLISELPIDPNNFLYKIELATQINHPNIVKILDYGKCDNSFFYVATEYIEGQTLEDILTEKKQLPLAEVVNYINLLCDIINVINENEQIHQDLKPANIIVTSDNQLKLYHSLIAHHKRLSRMKNKAITIFEQPFYFSPEQCQNTEVDERSEIYSLGAILYRMLTGEVPFSGQNYLTIMEHHIRQKVKDPCLLCPELPDNIARVILRALEKEPDRRFQSVLALSNLLMQATKQKVVNKIVDERPTTEKLPLAQAVEIVKTKKATFPDIQVQEFPQTNVEGFSQTSFNEFQETRVENPVVGLENKTWFDDSSMNSVSEIAVLDETDTNRTIEVTSFKLPQKRKSEIVSRKEIIELEQKQQEQQIAVNIVSELVSKNDEIENIVKNIEDNIAESQNISINTDPLPNSLQDGTKPLPPELQALYGSLLSNPISNPKTDSLSDKERNKIVNNENKVTINNEVPAQEVTNKATNNVLEIKTLSPVLIALLFADKILPPAKDSQYKRKLHNTFVVERETSASLLLVLSIFSLRRRKAIKFVPLSVVPQILQRRLIVGEDEKIVIQLVNAGVKPLDSFEQSVLKSLGKNNAISLYGLYQYFFVISDEQKIAIAELINDAVADELAKNKLLTLVSRDAKTPVEPGGSLQAYVLAQGLEINNYLPQHNDLVEFMESLKKEAPLSINNEQIQLYSYMLNYYKVLFCQHSYTFEY